MLYMVIERFKKNAAPAIYQRFHEKGRMLPAGLDYIASWVDHDRTICWQIMKTDDRALFQIWTERWQDLVEFEIVPVSASAET